MFGWRRRNEGFEWREYVRTTILARRARRREKIGEAKDAAIAGLKEAGRRGAEAGAHGLVAAGEGIKVAGRRGAEAGAYGLIAAGEKLKIAGRRGSEAGAYGLVALGVALREGSRRGASAGAALIWWLGHGTLLLLRALARVPGILAHYLGPVLAPIGRMLARRLEPIVHILEQREVRAVIGVIAAVAGIAVIARMLGPGFDRETAAALIIVLASLGILCLPRLVNGPPPRLPEWAGFLRGFSLRLPVVADASLRNSLGFAAAVVVVALVAAGGWLAVKNAPRMANLIKSPFGSSSSAMDGRATALTGDTLRLRGTTVRLASIEAPELDQSCVQNGSRRWRCGQTAKEALARVLRRGSVSCEISGSDSTGRARATCLRGDMDVAADLVRRGYVFAESGLFARYATLEEEARKARTGIWRGEQERPAAYRAKRWEEAKRAAPDGCPIKGQVSNADGRVYVLPWSPSYDRIKVRTTRGERWFCSEAEAKAAGWKPVERS